MAVRIRLARHGRKARPFYHIVVSDSRAPRNGRFVERIGSYNPMTSPATVDIDFDRAIYWLRVGAQPSDTARSILSHRGIMLKFHLLKGVDKGALTEEQANQKFDTWMQEKESKIKAAEESTNQELDKELKKRLEAEAKINEERAQRIAKKNAQMVEAEQKADSADDSVSEPVAETDANTETAE